MARRVAEGKTTIEVIRCLKRYLALDRAGQRRRLRRGDRAEDQAVEAGLVHRDAAASTGSDRVLAVGPAATARGCSG
jgi:hypothetical protein